MASMMYSSAFSLAISVELLPWETRHCGLPPGVLVKQPVSTDFLCCICDLLLKQPTQSACGHRYCKVCIVALLDGKDALPCPACLKEPEETRMDADSIIVRLDTLHPDNALRRLMVRQPSHCVNINCPWEGTFGEYEISHYPVCDYHRIKCGLCNEFILVKDNESHKQNCQMREVDCEFCNEIVAYSKYKLHLAKECPKQTVQCDSCDAAPILRAKLDDHYSSECRVYKVPCQNGCRFVFFAPAEQEHHDEEFVVVHTRNLMNRVNSVECSEPSTAVSESEQTSIEEIKQRIVILSERVEMGSRGEYQGPFGELELKINKMNEDSVEHLTKIGSIDTRIEYLDDSSSQVSLLMQQQLKGLEARSKEFEKTNSTQDVIFQGLQQRLKVLEETSYSGSYVWTIHNFKRRFKEAQEGRIQSIYSQVFYSDRFGYSMRLRLYLNGDGQARGKYMSLYFVLVKGEYDALLHWPFGRKVSFVLVNQSNPDHSIKDSFMPDASSKSFKRPLYDMNVASGCPYFVSHDKLNDGGDFVKNDTLFIKCNVDTNVTDQPGKK